MPRRIKDVNDAHVAGGASNVRQLRAGAREVTGADHGGGGGGGPPGGEADIEFLADPKHPVSIARAFLNLRYTWSERRLPTLLYWRGGWWAWRQGCWGQVDEEAMQGDTLLWLERCHRKVRDGRTAPLASNERLVKAVLHAMRTTLARVPGDFEGGWLPSTDPDVLRYIEGMPPANELLAVHNGLLHLPEALLFNATPAFFSPTTSPIAWDDKAPAPARFKQLLEEIWPDDKESRDALQEVFGYIVGPTTNLHKIIGIIGPPRSGKSRLMEVLRRIVGPDVTCSPTLSSLGRPFGREQLIGKKLAMIPDARLGRQSDASEIVQTLLAISGEDSQTVERKNQAAWNGVLGTKFLFVSNELPSLSDAAGALASRLLMLQMRISFLGKEDLELGEKLAAELPGILAWAVEGWQRLRRRGRFTQPASGEDALRVMREMNSDVPLFIEEKCELGPAFTEPTKDLHAAYNAFRKERDEEPVKDSLFGRKLRAAFPSIEPTHPRQGGTRVRHYKGVRLKFLYNTEKGEDDGNI